MSKDFDYSAHTVQELKEIQAEIPKWIAKLQREDIASARHRVEQIAHSLGMSVAALMSSKTGGGGKGNAKVRAKAAPKFADPSNPAITWSGVGRVPLWVREWEEKEGQTRDDLRIKSAA